MEEASYRGRERFVEFMRAFTDDFERYSVRIGRSVAATDDRVVLHMYHSATGRGSGVPVENEVYCVYELQDGRVVRIHGFFELDQALPAAGVE